ncbi:serpin family protein [Leptolyngbya sp. CCNP1308]|uniref:serpin family protein n=1 Tax=Leptolyngbya sp. CCNP1308 TaxID=3110255 RepID=UPI002B1FE76D|nr:serpin family protein [Leptolyngbya sp. CCNP1308]MEA5450720.1 serpin family protein [Leptolyngbya sp. CCNP1308]
MEHRWIGWAALSSGLAALTLGCAQLQAQPPTAPDPTPYNNSDSAPRLSQIPTVDTELTQAQLDFGFALFERLRQATPDENVLVSPTSVALALAMAYNGAGGETQAAIAATLQLHDLDIDQLNAGNQALTEYLTQRDPEVALAIANSLWVNQDLPVRSDYVERMQTAYSAEVAALDFSQPTATDRINTWVKAKTRDRIPTIVDELPADQLLVLVNAIYFKGAWSEAFDPARTTDRPFTLASGETVQHPLMAQQDDYLYLETDQFQSVSLPYGDASLSFEVILPAPGTDLATLAAQLTPENWQSWMVQMRSRPGEIQLPKLQFEYEADLIPTLQALGMGIAFEDGADFSGLTELDAFINQVRHKTFIEVNEAGTEAAASTAIGIMPTSIALPPDPPFEMVVDRPFLAAIRDRNTGTVLFVGAIVDPRP